MAKSKLVKANEKIAEKVVGGYKKIEEGVVGALVLVVMVLVWRKMEKKNHIRLSGKVIGTVLLGIVGALLLGVGMCLTMVWSNMILGIVIGIVGIVVLLCLIPLTKGLK